MGEIRHLPYFDTGARRIREKRLPAPFQQAAAQGKVSDNHAPWGRMMWSALTDRQTESYREGREFRRAVQIELAHQVLAMLAGGQRAASSPLGRNPV